MDLTSIKNVIALILSIVSLITLIVGAHKGYVAIQTSIGDNKALIERTQMMILKTKVTKYEVIKCPVSQAEWDEYIENYSTLYDLKIKHKKISAKTPWKPAERIMVKGVECIK